MGRGNGAVARHDFWAWSLAILVAAAPAILASVSSDVEEWIPVYVAGGLGGIVLELLLSRWQLELPSRSPAVASPGSADAEEEGEEEDSEETEAIFGSPTGSRLDLGFLGRFFTAGLAAVALLILSAVVLGDESLKQLQARAGSAVNIAWAVAIGASSPAVWRALRKIVEARVAAVRRRYDRRLSAQQEKLRMTKKAIPATLKSSREARDKAKKSSAGRARRPASPSVRPGKRLLVTEPELSSLLKAALSAQPPPAREIERRVAGEISNLPTEVADEDEPAEEAEALESLDKTIGALELLERQLAT
jgi:hypothetical protein